MLLLLSPTPFSGIGQPFLSLPSETWVPLTFRYCICFCSLLRCFFCALFVLRYVLFILSGKMHGEQDSQYGSFGMYYWWMFHFPYWYSFCGKAVLFVGKNLIIFASLFSHTCPSFHPPVHGCYYAVRFTVISCHLSCFQLSNSQ